MMVFETQTCSLMLYLKHIVVFTSPFVVINGYTKHNWISSVKSAYTN